VFVRPKPHVRLLLSGSAFRRHRRAQPAGTPPGTQMVSIAASLQAPRRGFGRQAGPCGSGIETPAMPTNRVIREAASDVAAAAPQQACRRGQIGVSWLVRAGWRSSPSGGALDSSLSSLASSAASRPRRPLRLSSPRPRRCGSVARSLRRMRSRGRWGQLGSVTWSGVGFGRVARRAGRQARVRAPVCREL
jgi:hypothetical protein